MYVGYLSWQTSWQYLNGHFRSAGVAMHADVMRDGWSKGCGLVAFANAQVQGR